MNAMLSHNLLLPLIVLGVALPVVVVAAMAKGASGKNADDFKAKPLLTSNELEFLGRLEAAAPELRMLAQVSMGALMDPNVSSSKRKAYMAQRSRISQKVVDFVAMERSAGRVIALIELDDRTHVASKDAARDAMTASAGYRTLRFTSRAKPDAAQIRAALYPPPPPPVEPSAPTGRRR